MSQNLKSYSKIYLFLSIIFLVFNSLLYAQRIESTIIDNYEDYAAAPREVIYTHLNKSTYIEGEMLGFTAYIFDKFTKKRSEMTTNLYCTISDEQGNIIKKQMVLVNNGIASNVFNIDEEFDNGSYTFKAYTNWMLNFKEQNHFQQIFNVIDADSEAEIKSLKDDSIDIQLLGEGGHLLYGTINTAGVIVKNKSGYGLPNAKGKIVDENETIITEFTLNDFGIAKVIFKPEVNKRYFTIISYNENVSEKEIKDIKSLGFNMGLTDIQKNIALSFNTNATSLARLQKKSFSVALHNGDELKLIPLNFNTLEEKMILSKTELFSGINIFTVFDENNNPVLERLFFNHVEKQNPKLNFMSAIKENDSLLVTLKLNNTQSDAFQNISISVLPSTTKSYSSQNNINSQLYLQPYIKGAIENAGYYFKNVTRKTKYELDMLLITQGWSSYDWTNIFNFSDNFSYPFERGIDVVTTLNDEKSGGVYLVYPLKNNTTQIFTLGDNEKTFTQKRVIPNEGEQFRVGQVKSNSKQTKPGVYPQFYPSTFPTFKLSYPYLISNGSEFSENIKIPTSLSSWDKVEKLDEVVINSQKKYDRLEILRRKTNNAQIKEVTDDEKNRGTPLSQIITGLGFYADYDYVNAQFIITNPRVFRGDPRPLLYLNDGIISDPNILRDLPVEVIDYIEAERYGIGGGFRTQAGYIKIYTSSDYFYRNDGKNKTTSVFDFPLTFNSPKKYYTPAYQFYNTTFFKEYGTIGWLPNLKTDSNGMVSFKIFDTKSENISLHIEGIVNNDELISETKTISPN
jgi:hypothetical protein